MHMAKNANYRYTFIPVLKKCMSFDGRATPMLTIPIYSSHLLTLQDIFMKSGSLKFIIKIINLIKIKQKSK